MANTVTRQILQDGDRNAVVHAYIASDGAAGEETDAVVVDASALDGSPTSLSIVKVQIMATGASAVLEWDATTDVPFLAIPDGANAEFCFEDIGGLQNNAGAGVTGDVLATTTGLSTAGDALSITFWLRKQ